MKKAIELADTTFRAYRKKNGATALHLKTHLIIQANAEFRSKIQNARPWINKQRHGLSAFMAKHPECSLKLSNGQKLECELVGYCPDPESRSISHPTGGGYVTFESQDITDGECLLFRFYVEMILRDKSKSIFDEGNHRGVSIAYMKLAFYINFPDRPQNERIIFQRKVPIVRHGYGW